MFKIGLIVIALTIVPVPFVFFLFQGLILIAKPKPKPKPDPVLMVTQWSSDYSEKNVPTVTVSPESMEVCLEMKKIFDHPEYKFPIKLTCVEYPYSSLKKEVSETLE